MSFKNQVANSEAETMVMVERIVSDASRCGECLNMRLVAIARTQIELGYMALNKAVQDIDHLQDSLFQNNG